VAATTVEVAAILFAATFVRSTLGFGEALVAVPLLALVMPVTVAAPIAALVSITVAAVVVVQDWRQVHWGSAARLVLATLAGIPIGLLLLTRAPEPLVKSVLALVIIVFSMQALRGPAGWRLAGEGGVWIFGLAAGVLGGAYGMNGPPLAVYGSARQWSPSQFRATLQGYFLPASAAGMIGYWSIGLWTSSVTRFYLTSLPAVVIAIVLGRVVNKRMSGLRFAVAVYMSLLAIAILLLIQSARSIQLLTIL
jgi:uncharacterized membrane protein YfcA